MLKSDKSYLIINIFVLKDLVVKKFFLTVSFLLFLSLNAASYETFYCKVYETKPYLDLKKYPLPNAEVRIDFKKKKMYPLNNVKLYDLKFKDNLVSWGHLSTNPVNGEKVVSFSYFDRNNKTLLIRQYPDKKNLKPSDLIITIYANCF